MGEFRELKFTTEKYFRKEILEEELLAAAKEVRRQTLEHLSRKKASLKSHQMTFLTMTKLLDAAFLFNVVPASVQNLDLSDLERYFALGRGYQGEKKGMFVPFR